MATAKTGSDASFARLPTWGKLLLLVGLVAVIAAIYYSAVHMAYADDLDDARNRHRQLLTQQEQAHERNREYLRLRAEAEARQGLDAANRMALPESAETAAFLQDLNRLAELSGLRILLVEPRPEEPEEFYVRLPVNLQLSGRYHQLARFFHNISGLDRLISMENIQLANPALEGEDVVLQVSVLATTYRARGAEDQGSTAAPNARARARAGS